MTTSSPIRVLVAGGTTTERGEIEQALRSDQSFSIVGKAGSETPAADAVVLIQSADPDACLSGSGKSAQLATLPLHGAKAVVVSKSESMPKQDSLAQLPEVLRHAIREAKPSNGGATDTAEEAALATRAMRESQRLAAIGKLTAEIAHEINNPLESVGNLLYLAMREPGIPLRTVEYLRSAEQELERIAQISKQTLSFSRESAEPVALQVTELMDEVIGLYSRRIAHKKLSIIREYGVQAAIRALPGEIRQVLSNLVTNAIEATQPGGKIRLRIRAAHQHAGRMTRSGLRISVADNGSGIPEATRRRLGQMFFTTKGESGTGLGLWVTKSVIARYGGTMNLRSSTTDMTHEKHGTIFTIFMPSADTERVAPENIGHREASSSDEENRGNVTEISQHPSFANHSQNGAESASPFRKREG